MHIDSDDLLARIKRDYPYEFEITQLRTVVDLLTAENEQLRSAQTAQTPSGSYPTLGRPYVGTAALPDDDGGRHGS